MKLHHSTLIVTLSTMVFTAASSRAETITLTDGSLLQGELGAPSEVTIQTPNGERRVAFALLPAELQKIYWTKSAAIASGPDSTGGVTPVPNPVSAAVAAAVLAEEELALLSTEVNLDTWAQIAAIGSFRDKAEKRGAGGLVVTKAFNALEENWVSVYSLKHPIGAAGNWNEQLAKARTMQARTTQFMQKRWLELFVKAGEAVARRDSNEFAVTVRELKRSGLTAAVDAPKNFFTAK